MSGPSHTIRSWVQNNGGPVLSVTYLLPALLHGDAYTRLWKCGGIEHTRRCLKDGRFWAFVFQVIRFSCR